MKVILFIVLFTIVGCGEFRAPIFEKDRRQHLQTVTEAICRASMEAEIQCQRNNFETQRKLMKDKLLIDKLRRTVPKKFWPAFKETFYTPPQDCNQYGMCLMQIKDALVELGL